MIEKVVALRPQLASRPCPISTNPGYYRWWMRVDAANQLLANLKGIDNSKIRKRIIDGNTYCALYFGIAKSIRQRFRWHICQRHTAGNIRNHTLSTLRHTLSALLGLQPSVGVAAVNAFIDEACMIEWEYTATKADAEAVEHRELTDPINGGYYPLNIKENRNVDPLTRRSLSALRAQYKS